MGKPQLTPLVFIEQTAPSTPPTGYVAVYAKSDGKMYRLDDTGAEVELGGATGGSSDDVDIMFWMTRLT